MLKPKKSSKKVKRVTKVRTLPKNNNFAIVPEGERKCPICSGMMKSEIKHAIMVDVCPEHGVWLDVGELERMIGLRDRMKRKEFARRLKEEKTEAKSSALAFGVFSLLMD